MSGSRGQQRHPTGNGIHLSLSRTAVATAAALGGFGVLSGVYGGSGSGVGKQQGVTTMSAATAAGQGPEGGNGNALLEQVCELYVRGGGGLERAHFSMCMNFPQQGLELSSYS